MMDAVLKGLFVSSNAINYIAVRRGDWKWKVNRSTVLVTGSQKENLFKPKIVEADVYLLLGRSPILILIQL